MTELPAKRFRVALSFAGEKREFVEKVAGILARCFGKELILYDKYFEAEFAVFNLGIKLPKLYDEESDLIVPVLCEKYDDKLWTGWEWGHIYTLLTKQDGHRVMPSRFDHATADGLTKGAGFIELDHKTPHEFAGLILQRLASNEGLPTDHYTQKHARHLTPSPSIIAPNFALSIPHNLPALQPFFGREEELGQIALALEPESRGWGALIDGPGGMGKTSLAVRAAHAVPPGVFECIHFVTLKSRELDEDGVRDLSGFMLSGLTELLGELARLLGREDLLKQPEDLRPRLLLEALRGTRALLILDNLESLVRKERDTVFTFVNRLPAGCKAILTSRGRIGSGAAELILGRLSEEAALATLAELATHNPELAKTSEAERLVLYRETGGAPLLLRWTAGQIGRGHCRTFAHAIDYLRSCPPGNDALEFVFGDLVSDFSPAEMQALSALTFFTQPAKVEHIAAIAGVESQKQAAGYAKVWDRLSGALAQSKPPMGTEPAASRAVPARATGPAPGSAHVAVLAVAEIEQALRSLANRSLVVPSTELQAFTLVPLVADFLRRHQPGVIATTGQHLQQRALALIVENGGDKYERFPVLDAAWPGVAPALPLFVAGDNDRLQEVCAALQKFLNFTGRWDERLALCQQAEARAVAAGDHAKAGWRARDAGWVHYLRGQAEAVLACAERATAHWQQAFPSDSSGQEGVREHAAALQLRGLGHRLQKDYPAAIAAFRQVVELDRSLDAESADVALDLNTLANAESLSGDFAAAERDYREALRVARVVGDAEGIAIYTGNLAALALDREDWPQAEALAREALALAEKLGREELIASNNHRLAKALSRQGRGAEGLPHARRAVEIFTRLGMEEDIAHAQETLEACEEAIAPPAETETGE